jgi:hypothetical protein
LFSDAGIGNFSFGAEYLYDGTVAIRAGQQFGAYGGLTGLTGFSVGAGVKVDKWDLDYSFVTRGDLGTSNLLSFNYNFGGEGTSTPTATPIPVVTPIVTSSVPTVVPTPIVTASPVTEKAVEKTVDTAIPSMASTVTEILSETPVVTEQTSTPTATIQSIPQQASVPSGQWWDEPFDAMAAFDKLRTQLVPDLIAKGQMAVLGKDAAAFFAQAKKDGATPEALSAMRCGYYTAIASQLFDQGRVKDAAYYLKIALSSQPNNPDTLALKAKLDKAQP